MSSDATGGGGPSTGVQVLLASLGMVFLLLLAMPWSMMSIMNGEPVPWGIALSGAVTVVCARWVRRVRADDHDVMAARLMAAVATLVGAGMTLTYLLAWVRSQYG